jgi:hypothetical protein
MGHDQIGKPLILTGGGMNYVLSHVQSLARAGRQLCYPEDEEEAVEMDTFLGFRQSFRCTISGYVTLQEFTRGTLGEMFL